MKKNPKSKSLSTYILTPFDLHFPSIWKLSLPNDSSPTPPPLTTVATSYHQHRWQRQWWTEAITKRRCRCGTTDDDDTTAAVLRVNWVVWFCCMWFDLGGSGCVWWLWWQWELQNWVVFVLLYVVLSCVKIQQTQFN